MSAKAKSRYTLAASVLGGFFFLGEFILPMVLQMLFMPGMMWAGSEFQQSHVGRCVFWEGRVWYPEESTKGMGRKQTRLRSLVVGSEDEPEPGIEVPMSPPWLLPGEGTLWLISPGAVGYFEEGNVTVVKPRKRLGNISRPFWYEGTPAVIEKTPAGQSLWTFSDGEWNRNGLLSLTAAPEQPRPLKTVVAAPSPWNEDTHNADLQIVAAAGEMHVFMRSAGTVYYRKGLEFRDRQAGNVSTDSDEEGWQVVGEIDGAWFATELDAEPVVFHAGDAFASSGVTGLKFQNGRWDPFFHDKKTRATELGVCALDEPGHFALLGWKITGGMKLLEVRDHDVIGSKRLGGFFPFNAQEFAGMYVFTIALPMVMSLGLVFVLAALMNRFRQREFVSGTQHVRFASLPRRAVAKLIDSLVFVLPMVPAAVFLYRDFDLETAFDSPQIFFQKFFSGLIWIAVAVAGSLVLFFVFSFLEGKWGLTPGKWIVGIRVWGTDLKPRGFWMALARNLLLLGDMFFNHLVGILMIAFTQNWQRLGDLVAGTIVVHRNHSSGVAELVEP